MNLSKLLIIVVFLFPALALAESNKPIEHKHENSKRQHAHHLPKLDPNEHSHDAREKNGEEGEAPILVPITSSKTMEFDRKVGSYSKYDAPGDMIMIQISFQAKKIETNETVLGVAEIPLKSCENEVMGRVYIAYDDSEDGEWHSFERDNKETYPKAFEDHICKIYKSR